MGPEVVDEMAAALERELTITHRRLAEAIHEAEALDADADSLRTTVRLMEVDAGLATRADRAGPRRRARLERQDDACGDAVMTALIDTRARLARELERTAARRQEMRRLAERAAYIEGTYRPEEGTP